MADMYKSVLYKSKTGPVTELLFELSGQNYHINFENMVLALLSEKSTNHSIKSVPKCYKLWNCVLFVSTGDGMLL